MIDKQSRLRAASLLRELIDGEISNDDFDNAYPESRDSAVDVIRKQAWLVYDDRYTHHLVGRHALSPDDRATLERCLAFLGTELEYEGPPIETGLRALVKNLCLKIRGGGNLLNSHDGSDLYYWPFTNVNEYHKHTLSAGRAEEAEEQ